MSQQPCDTTEAIATVADLLELAARRVWDGAGAGAGDEASNQAQSVGLGIYLLSSHVHAHLTGGDDRVGIDPGLDHRTAADLVTAAEQGWSTLPRSARPEGWRTLLRDLRTLSREVQELVD